MRYRRAVVGLAACVLTAASLTLLGAAPVAAALPPQCTTSGSVNVTCTFRHDFGNTNIYSLTIPEGVASAHLHVVGAAGQASTTDPTSTKADGAPGGRPAVIDADLTTSPGDGLVVEFRDNGGIGHFAGGDDTAGPYLPASGSGGGSSVVRRAADQGGQLIAEAGGGGGGGLVSAQHLTQGSLGGDAGDAGKPGSWYGTDVDPAEGGSAGTANDGLGGSGATVDVGSPAAQTFASGSPGSGSEGGDGAPGDLPGGGGGGGTTAGGGGGAGGTGVTGHADGGGGGGGSSTLPAGGTLGVSQSESALVRITFTLDVHATYSPTSIDFGNVNLGMGSDHRDITLTNTSSVPIVVGSGTLSGAVDAFHVLSDGCNRSTLNPGASCTVTVYFAPRTRGELSASYSLSDSTSDSPHTTVLTGFGVTPIATVSPTSLDFAPQEVGTSGEAQTVTVTNTGDADLVIGWTRVSSDASFVVTASTCANETVAPQQSCSVSVAFEPTTPGRHAGLLDILHNAAGGRTEVALEGIAAPHADLKVLGVGSVYTGRDHLVTMTASAPGIVKKFPLVVLNEDTIAHSYRIRLDTSGMPAATAVRATSTNAVLPVDGTDSLTPVVQPGRTFAMVLWVTPTGSGQGTSTVRATLLSELDAPIESVTTGVNIAAPTHGTSSYELFARQGSQLFVGGQPFQTMTGPALNVGASAAYVVRLRNDGPAPSQIGLRLTDADGCPGSFVVTAVVGTKVVTAETSAGTFLTRVLRPGGYQDVRVTIRRSAPGCPARLIRAESLDHGSVVRTSYLLANAAYDPATD